MSCPINRSITLKASTTQSNNGSYGANSLTSNNMEMTNQTRPQYNSNVTQANPFFTQRKCRKVTNEYPSFTPVLFSLSTSSSPAGRYSLVYINGENFLPVTSGTTYVNFGSFQRLPITYFSSATISFVVPLNAKPGNYSVFVVNVYNSNFSPPVNYTYSGNLNPSNALNYTIT